MKLVRFRVMEPDLGEPEDIHYGYASEDGTIYCGCGCHGTFELEDCWFYYVEPTTIVERISAEITVRPLP